jgi:hypothetical protein
MIAEDLVERKLINLPVCSLVMMNGTNVESQKFLNRRCDQEIIQMSITGLWVCLIPSADRSASYSSGS